MERIKNYLGGEWHPPHRQAYLSTINPATGELLAEIPASDKADLDQAVEAARIAFPTWSELSVQARSQFLWKMADGIAKRLEEFAQLESQDNGKPVWLARKVDIPRAVDNFRFFSQAITQFSSEFHDMGQVGFNYTLRRPLGVVGLISPWNLPLYLFTWKIAPALAAGNTAVAKPSEVTPLTANLLAEVCQSVELPAGVLNIIHGRGSEVGEALVQHPEVAAISFTGSTRVGKRIAKVAGPSFKKLSLEMGGKNASLVFADADYDAALKGVLRSSYTNQGQICLCSSRILVEESIYEKFAADLAGLVSELKVGDPLDPDTQVGAIVSQAQWEKDQSYLKLALEEGGQVLAGGEVPAVPDRCKQGYFLSPTLIAGLDGGCRVNQEEIFGPIATIQPFHSEEEGLLLANGTPYGLSATIWTQDLKRAHRVAASLEAGIIWVNSWMVRDLRTPFGGMKQSGLGREGGFEALKFFTESKNIFISLDPD
ncbi:MAG: aldehyde dehydrogenase [Bacteroidota bacterium]